MKLELNDGIVLPYKEFFGRNIKTMPQLIADRRVPLSVVGLMERRLRAGESVGSWRDNYFDTADAFAYHPDGKFKIVLDSRHVRELSPKSRLSNGALILADGMYETLEGPEFSRNDANILFDEDIDAVKDIKAHPVWQALARGDTALLNEYVDVMTAADIKSRYGHHVSMGVHLQAEQTVPTLRAAWVDRLGIGSRLYGYVNLDSVWGRFAGVAPEAQNAPSKVIQRPTLKQAPALVNTRLGDLQLKTR